MRDARDALVRTVMTSGEDLDDVARARMWSKIENQLEKARAAPQPATSRRGRWIAAAGIAAVAAAAVVALRGFRDGPTVDQQVVLADTVLTSRLGPYARAALIGPARLEWIGPAGAETRVRLLAGTLLAEFEGGPGRSLRIETRELTVEVVGTLFAVEARASTTCVAVAHGRVRVIGRSEERFLTDREEWCSDERSPHAMSPRIATELRRHAATLVMAEPAATDMPMLGATAPPVSPRPNDQKPAPEDVPRAAPVLRVTRPAGSSRPEPSRVARAPSIPASAPRQEASSDANPVAESAAPRTEPSSEELYAMAEAALSTGDRKTADRMLARVVEDPLSPLADQALYERGWIAYTAQDWAAARRHLASLARLTRSPLAESGRYLDCRIAVKTSAPDAETCLVSFRASYPRSPHDLDVLALLVQIAHAGGGCRAAQSARDELARSYPRSDHAAAWRARCQETR